MRIVTTLPTATEIVSALGVSPVGVSHQCDVPASVRSIPSVTTPRLDLESTQSAREIDRQVSEAASVGSLYEIDAETLDRLEPDLVLTQGMCDVCATSDADVRNAIAAIDADPDVVTTDPHTMDDVLEDVERVGEAIGRPGRARDLVGELKQRIDRVRSELSAADPGDRPRVAIFDWTDPVMVAGHWTAELVSWAGGEYGLADRGARSRPRTWDEIVAYDPELVIVAPCGFGLSQAEATRSDLEDRDGWADLAAVRENRVWAMDGNHHLNRPGPRLVDTLEALAGIVRPDRFDPPSQEDAIPFDSLTDVEAGS